MLKHSVGCIQTLIVFAVLVSGGVARAEEGGLTPQEHQDLARHFGFTAVEIHKIEQGISQLRIADFNGDGAKDLVVTNNKKSLIDVLIQRTSKPDSPDEPQEVNDLADHWRFEHKKVSVSWGITCLKTADVTADGKVDLVFFSNTNELVVLPGNGDGSFDDARTRRVRDGMTLPSAMDVADVNGDGREDVVLLGESSVLVFAQNEKGGLDNPERFAHALENPLALRATDLDGNSLNDIVLLSDEEDFPLRVRFQTIAGEFGPVQRVRLPALRSATFEGCFERAGKDLFGVERVSGRMKRWTIRPTDTVDSDDSWAVLQLPIPGRTDADRLPLAVGDVNGDKLRDVITADVDAAQLVLYLQDSARGLQPSKSFGGQVGMTDARCLDEDGDGLDEVYVCSPDERTIARSVYANHRLTFPKALPTFEKPFALDLTRLDSEHGPVLAYVSRDEDSTYWFVVQPLSAESVDEAIAKIELEDMDEPPTALRWVDANRDGRQDVLIFSSDEPLVTVLSQADGTFEVMAGSGETQTGLVNDARIQNFTLADTHGDGEREILLAQKSFVRALRINDDGAWEILDQYNTPTSDSEIAGICAVSDNARPAFAVYERRGREVLFFKPDESGTYALDRPVSVGAIALKFMTAAPLGGTGTPSVMLASNTSLTLIQPDRPALIADERAVYESSIKDARLYGVAVGDLNHDGVTDIAVVDGANHFVELVTFAPDGSLVRGNKFRVFARKQFRRRQQQAAEPRWIEIDDVTNDGYDDLILIAHDRILIYPSE